MAHDTQDTKKFDGVAKRTSGDVSLTPSLLSKWELIATLGPGKCQHCKKNRRRTHTYQIQDEHGECLIVGENCLGLFVREHWKSLENLRAERIKAQQSADEKHHAEMVADPDTVLAHAMCHLFVVSGEYAPYSYIKTVQTIQDARGRL